MPRIMIVDDNVVSVMELEEVLTVHGYGLAGVAYSGEEAVEIAEKVMPDLILMDIKMPGKLDGISAAKKIIAHDEIPVVFVTGHYDEELLERAGQLNPAGYILKPFVGSQIMATVEIALRSLEIPKKGNKEIHPNLNIRVPPQTVLTPAESRVAELIKKGKKSKDIALILDLSKKTVDWHRTNIRRKLGLSDKQNLFAFFQKT